MVWLCTQISSDFSFNGTKQYRRYSLEVHFHSMLKFKMSIALDNYVLVFLKVFFRKRKVVANQIQIVITFYLNQQTQK
jgi:hypothetical protein